MQDLSYLLLSLDSNSLMGRFSELNRYDFFLSFYYLPTYSQSRLLRPCRALVGLIEDFGLVAFETLDVTVRLLLAMVAFSSTTHHGSDAGQGFCALSHTGF